LFGTEGGDYRVDIYAFGVSVLEILAARRPYSSSWGEFQIIGFVLGGGRPPLEELDIDVRMKPLIAACWHQGFFNKFFYFKKKKKKKPQ
jgi:hypothetical protein